MDIVQFVPAVQLAIPSPFSSMSPTSPTEGSKRIVSAGIYPLTNVRIASIATVWRVRVGRIKKLTSFTSE